MSSGRKPRFGGASKHLRGDKYMVSDDEYNVLLDRFMRLRVEKNHLDWERIQALERSLEVHKAYIRIRDKLVLARKVLTEIEKIADDGYDSSLITMHVWEMVVDTLRRIEDKKPLAHKW